jgi:diguanylate cyclase (GGDEF)-like protein
LRHGQLHAVTNARLDIICPHWRHGPWPANSLCVPMMAQGDSLGVLLLRRPAVLPVETGAVEARSTISREQLAVTVASHIALALANLRLRDSLRLQSIRDSLTGLYNRRYLNEVLEREVRRAARGQRQLAVIMLDVDGFKGLNDTYGHEAGDQCLVRIAKLLHNHALRSSDMAARFGGEEFALILPETSRQDSARIAASIIDDLAHLHIPHTASSVTDHVTVSIGIASMVPDEADNDSALRESADQMLYEAKHAGRNRLVCAPDMQAHAASAPFTAS